MSTAAAAASKPAKSCAQCNAGDATSRPKTADSTAKGGQPAEASQELCFDCFERAANQAQSEAEAEDAAATIKKKKPAEAAASKEKLDATEAAEATKDDTKEPITKPAEPSNEQPTTNSAADADSELQSPPDDDLPPPSMSAADHRLRLRKSTRSTRYKSKSASSASVPASPAAGSSAALNATFSGSASQKSNDISMHAADDPASSVVGTSSSATAASTSADAASTLPASAHPKSAAASAGENPNTKAPEPKPNNGGGGKAPKGRSRRGALFKKHPPQRAPTVTATTRSVEHCFHAGSYMQVGDIVSVCGHTGDLYYAQIRGLLVDAFCEKSAYLTWLLPTLTSPPANERFDAATYVIGPDEERARRLECMQFVMHAPSGYYRSGVDPYPEADGAMGGSAGGPVRGFIWTSLGEVGATGARVVAGRERRQLERAELERGVEAADAGLGPGGGVVVV